MTPGGKVYFSEGELKELEQYIRDELDDAVDNEHNEREQRLSEWDRAYVGDPKQAKRHFPWPGAANVEIPLIGITVDSIVARIVNTIFAMEPFWTMRPMNKQVEPTVKPIQDYLEWSRKNEFNLYKAARTNTIELVKYGWSWYKVCWELYRQPYYQAGPNGEFILKDNIIKRPMVYHVINRDVITQAGVEDEEQAEWIAHRFRLTDNQLRLRVRDGLYEIDLDKTLKSKEDQNEYHEAMKSERTVPGTSREKLNTFFELWMDWRYGKDNVPVPMVVVYHRPTNKVCRAVFNPYGFRALRKAKFIEREGRMEGIGIAKRLFQLQEELSTTHRQQIDNATLANTRFFIGKRNVVRANTQIWPGRVLLVNDPGKDLIGMQLGDIYQSQGVLESRALSYAERASGVSDYQLGRESNVAGSRATATSTLALIQEGNRRFDLNIRDVRDLLAQVGRDVLLLNQLYRPSGLNYMVQGQDGQYVEEAFKLPPEFPITKMAIELTATTATINKEIEKQGLIALMGITNQYYEKLIQASMLMINPQTPPPLRELIMKEVEGAQYLLKRIVQTFDIKSVDTIVPGLVDDARRELGGAPGLPAGSSPDEGMGNIPSNGEQMLRNGNAGFGAGGQLQ